MSKNPSDINIRAADMWSYAVLLWELATREVPFGDLPPMEAGMRVRNETYLTKLQISTGGLRMKISPGISSHMAKLIKICMNEDPGLKTNI